MDSRDEEELEPRARIFNEITGETRGVPKSALTGLDEFADSWETDVDMPHEFSFSGWQMGDDAHEPTKGSAAYRIVFKTIRSVPFPNVEVSMANLRMVFKNGVVTWGEPLFKSAISRRGAGRFIVPEWGTIKVGEAGATGYEHMPNFKVDISAHQDSTPDTNYVEILYKLPPGDWTQFDEMLAAGRAGTSTFTLFLDLVYGERVLGPILTEEVGEVFDDWHWNRLLGGRSVSIESQAAMQLVDGTAFRDSVAEAFKRHTALSEEARNRLRVAAQWYWRADREPDRVVRFISYWLCVEALELGENANIAPVKKKVASMLGLPQKDLGEVIGRLYGIRSGLVHGAARDVTDVLVENVRALALALLEDHSLGQLTKARSDELRRALGLNGPGSGAA